MEFEVEAVWDPVVLEVDGKPVTCLRHETPVRRVFPSSAGALLFVQQAFVQGADRVTVAVTEECPF